MTSIMTADLLAAESLCFIIYLFVTASTSTGECHDDDDAMTARPPTAPIADSKIASRSRAIAWMEGAGAIQLRMAAPRS